MMSWLLANSVWLMLEGYYLQIVFFSTILALFFLFMNTSLNELSPNKLAGSVSLNSGEIGGKSILEAM